MFTDRLNPVIRSISSALHATDGAASRASADIVRDTACDVLAVLTLRSPASATCRDGGLGAGIAATTESSADAALQASSSPHSKGHDGCWMAAALCRTCSDARMVVPWPPDPRRPPRLRRRVALDSDPVGSACAGGAATAWSASAALGQATLLAAWLAGGSCWPSHAASGHGPKGSSSAPNDTCPAVTHARMCGADHRLAGAVHGRAAGPPMTS
jgi:hypothetical protein